MRGIERLDVREKGLLSRNCSAPSGIDACVSFADVPRVAVPGDLREEGPSEIWIRNPWDPILITRTRCRCRRTALQSDGSQLQCPRLSDKIVSLDEIRQVPSGQRVGAAIECYPSTAHPIRCSKAPRYVLRTYRVTFINCTADEGAVPGP